VFELEGVAKSYAGRPALQPTTLALPRGQTLALLGPSGCGKSTLLRLMLGLLQPDEGVVRFDGAPLAAHDLPALRRRLGYVVQGGGLFPHLTAEGNATQVARHLGWPAPRRAARLAELAALTRFPPEALARFPAELSGGQAQRVSLMRALFLEPEVLLLDEPLGALDPITRYELQGDLKAVFARLGKTVVLVTHDLGEAAYLARTIALMREGRIVQLGPYEALERAPAEAFVSRFLQAQRPPGSGP
jgi:osmoprotectant transport system ATP-binding protein